MEQEVGSTLSLIDKLTIKYYDVNKKIIKKVKKMPYKFIKNKQNFIIQKTAKKSNIKGFKSLFIFLEYPTTGKKH